MKQNVNTAKKAETDQNNEFTSLLKYVAVWTCIFFTSITLIFLLIQSSISSEDARGYVDPGRFLMIFPFSLIAACGNRILVSKKTKPVVKALLHGCLLLADFYLCLCLPVSPSNGLAVIALLAVVYIVIASVILISLSAKAKKKRDSSEYKSMFGSKK